MSNSSLRIFLVAGEESGDRLGAPLMRALRSQAGDIEFLGVGGDQMAREGLVSLFPLHETAIMGFAAVPAKLRSVLARIRQTADAVVAARPDVLVIIDSPEFTHRVARRVRRLAPHIPIVDFVSPSVWAWRPGRARAMRKYIDHVLALLPFEPAAHQRLGGPPCTFVGHPLSERVGVLRPNAEESRRREAPPPILLVMPGSRRAEIGHMLPLFKQTIELIVPRVGPLDVVIPTVPALAELLREAIRSWTVKARVIDDAAEKETAFRSARAALVKSGTGTLELAIAGVPMVAAYRVGAIEAFVVLKLINVPSVILANLVLGKNVVPEFLQNDATPERLAASLAPLIGDTVERRDQIGAFKELDTIMQIGTLIPSERAARVILETARQASRA
ncbi:MAG: lipid-A-disaccharide synthase [Pseudolabrys sp.]|nr:lipid-A-disaccharide synthase [Pseudolabrys sp.]